MSAGILTGCAADANRDRLLRSLNDAISARRRPVQKADVIIYAVTAASSLDAAKSVKPQLSDAPYFLDLNWVSPAKQDTAPAAGNGPDRQGSAPHAGAILSAISAAV